MRVPGLVGQRPGAAPRLSRATGHSMKSLARRSDRSFHLRTSSLRAFPLATTLRWPDPARLPWRQTIAPGRPRTPRRLAGRARVLRRDCDCAGSGLLWGQHDLVGPRGPSVSQRQASRAASQTPIPLRNVRSAHQLLSSDGHLGVADGGFCLRGLQEAALLLRAARLNVVLEHFAREVADGIALATGSLQRSFVQPVADPKVHARRGTRPAAQRRASPAVRPAPPGRGPSEAGERADGSARASPAP